MSIRYNIDSLARAGQATVGWGCLKTGRIVGLSEKVLQMSKREDRRVRRTRRLLRDAFISLLARKEYEAITVRDIVDEADVARSTFYVHYLDKEDLLLGEKGIFGGDVDEHLRAQFMRHVDESSNSILPTSAVFYHIRAQRDIYRVLFGRSGMDLVIRKLQEILQSNIAAELNKFLADETAVAVPPAALIDYLSAALLSLIRWWLDHDLPYTPAEMDNMFQRLVMPGVYDVLGIKQIEASD